MTNCGPGGSGTESCCASLEVAAGTYFRTYTNTGDGGAAEADPATISGFRLDKYLVTVGRFRQFVKAALAADGGTGWLPPAGSGKHVHLNAGQGLANSAGTGGFESGWLASDNSNVAPTDGNLLCAPVASTWTSTPGSQENLPMNCLTWWEAYAFCIWDGGFLPSEAEWKFAAAGGAQQREYPWGSTDPGTTSQYAIYGCNYASDAGVCTSVSNIAPVGTAALGAGLWGQLDLVGDMWEWDLDWSAAFVNPCTDCAFLAATSGKMLGGTSFGRAQSSLLPGSRSGAASPTSRGSGGGVRCARAP